MKILSVSDNSRNDFLNISSTIIFHLIEIPHKRKYLPLMSLMMEIQFLLDVNFIFLVVFLPLQRSTLFLTWLSTVPQLYVLDLRILPKKKKLNREVDNRLTRCYFSGNFPNGNICLQIIIWFWKECNRLNKKVYCCWQVCSNCFETHHDSLVNLPWHVSCLTPP